MDHFMVDKTTVIGRPLFRCRKCNGVGVGSQMIVEKGNDLIFEISPKVLHPSHMPVGWASFYDPKGTVYECPNHKEA